MAKKNLNELYKKTNMSLLSFTNKINVPRVTLLRVLDGKAKINNMSVINAIRVCKGFNCKLSDLIEDEYCEEIREYENMIGAK